jgi:hypothetical protein
VNARATFLCLAIVICARRAEAESRVSLIEPGAERRATGFSLMDAKRTGVTFTNVLAPERHLTNNILLNGSGLACGDVDGDGRPDI